MNDTLFLNKLMASILVCGIVFMLAGFVADGVVERPPLKQTAIKIDVPKTQAAAPTDTTPALPPLAPLLAKASIPDGEAFMNKVCVACHTWNKGGPAKVGPNLYGIVGAPHAHMAGFDYSDGLKAIKGPWTFAELNQWLSNPRSVVPDTRMTYAGIDSSQTRADVVDYLHTLSPSPEPLPTATAPAKATEAAKGAGGNAAASAAKGAPPPTAGATPDQSGTEKAKNSTAPLLPPQAGTPGANPAGH